MRGMPPCFFVPWRLCGRIFFLVLFACLPACRKPQVQAQREPPVVWVATVAVRDVPVYREWIGNLDGSVNTEVRARVSGYLISQNYKEGSLVKAGDLLFKIDPRPLVAALHQAQGDLARADASEKLAAVNLKRANELYAGKVTSAQERDTSVANYGTTKADVVALEAAVETARLNVEFSQIVSPVDGIAGIANGQIGDLVGPNSAQSGPLTTVSVVDPIKAYFTITEQDYIAFARRLAKGTSSAMQDLALEMILADGSVYPRKGRFDFADRQVDVTTGAMRVAGLFANPDTLLRPGLFCRIRVQTDTRKGALLVPERAIAEVQGSYHVVVVGPDRKATIRPVELGEMFRENAEKGRGNAEKASPGLKSFSPWRVIAKGLNAGETVVVEGLQKVKEGDVVEPKQSAQNGERGEAEKTPAPSPSLCSSPSS